MAAFSLTMPKLSPTMEFGVIAKWHVGEGSYVESGQLLVEISTDKATVEYNALDPGWVAKIFLEEGKSAKVNELLAILTEEKNESFDEEKFFSVSLPSFAGAEPLSQPSKFLLLDSEPETEVIKRPFASPLAKKLAKEEGIDLSQIKGSGPGGRIMSRDLSSFPSSPSTVLEPLSPIRKVMAKRLQAAKREIPHFYVQQEVDVTSLYLLKQQLKNGGCAVTFNDLIIKAAALSLKRIPEINSGFDQDKQAILRFSTIDISVAVEIDGGVITPILFSADKKSLNEISQEMKVLSKKAKEGKLELHEFQGGSFSISNLGMFGITAFSAIINPPQGAILAVGGIREALKKVDGEIVTYQVMTLILSADHRIIDGSGAARFLQDIKYYFENPYLLLI